MKTVVNYFIRRRNDMLRIWKGPEMEGAKVGIMTLFVCSDKIIKSKTVIQMLAENPDIRRVYFGAGKHKFKGSNQWQQLYDYCFTRSIEIVIEVVQDELRDFVEAYDNLITTFIVVDYDVPFTYNNLQYKTDNNTVVNVYNVCAQTSLDTLKDNNLFTCDTMLLEEE